MKSSLKKLTSLAICGLVLIAGQIQATTFGFADIDVANVIGTGANKSGLVIDFNDGAATERYVYQYNWDGAAGTLTGADMIIDVAAAVSGLDISFFGTVEEGFFLTEITLGAQTETTGFNIGDPFWGYYGAGGTIGGNPAPEAGGDPIPALITSSSAGAGQGGTFDPDGDGPLGPTFFEGRYIADESWDVWSFGTFEPTYVVPEPSSFALLGGAFALLFVTLRRRVR